MVAYASVMGPYLTPRFARCVGALAVVALGGCGGQQDTNGATSRSDDFASDVLRAHNEIRAAVTAPANYPGTWAPLPPLAWSDAVAASAQTWANHLRDTASCNVALDESDGYGESIAGGTIGFKVTDVLARWAAEMNAYVYSPAYAFDSTTGHYTQVVWRSTTELGCGWAQCATGYVVYVCRYHPAGNVIGSQPY